MSRISVRLWLRLVCKSGHVPCRGRVQVVVGALELLHAVQEALQGGARGKVHRRMRRSVVGALVRVRSPIP